MAAKTLSVTFSFVTQQAEAAMKNLEAQMSQVVAREQELAAQGRNLDGTFMSTAAQADAAALKMKQFATETSAAGTMAGKALAGIGTALENTGRSLMNWVKYGSAFALATGALVTRDVINNLRDFSQAFVVLQGTVNARLPDTINQIKKAIFDLSNQTGISATEVTNSMAQMFSLLGSPTAPEGTQAFTSQLATELKIQNTLLKLGQATGTNATDITEAYGYAANALGFDPKKLETANKIADMFAITHTQAVGTLPELAQQFSKFSSMGNLAGFSAAEQAGMLASLTHVMDPNQAGMSLNSLFRTFAQGLQSSEMASNRTKLMEKAMTPQEKALVQQLTNPRFMSDIFTNPGKNGIRTTATGSEVMSRLNDLLNSYGAGTELRSGVANVLAGGHNALSARTLQLLLASGTTSGYEATFGPNGRVAAYASSGGEALKKIEISQASFAMTWDKAWTQVSNKFMSSVDAISPGLDLMINQLEALFSGQKVDPSELTTAFEAMKTNVAEVAPWMGIVMDKIIELNKYLNSDQAGIDFEHLKEGVVHFGEAIGNVFNAITNFANSSTGRFLINMFEAHPILSFVLSVTGWNLFKVAAGAYVEWMGAQITAATVRAFTASETANAATAMIQGSVTAGWLSALAVGAPIGVALGGLIANAILSARDKADAKQVAQANTAANMVAGAAPWLTKSQVDENTNAAMNLPLTFDPSFLNRGEISQLKKLGVDLDGAGIQRTTGYGLASKYGRANLPSILSILAGAEQRNTGANSFMGLFRNPSAQASATELSSLMSVLYGDNFKSTQDIAMRNTINASIASDPRFTGARIDSINDSGATLLMSPSSPLVAKTQEVVDALKKGMQPVIYVTVTNSGGVLSVTGASVTPGGSMESPANPQAAKIRQNSTPIR